MAEILEFKFDTQLLIEGHDLDEDEMERLLRLGGRCPYFRSGSEYDVARKQ